MASAFRQNSSEPFKVFSLRSEAAVGLAFREFGQKIPCNPLCGFMAWSVGETLSGWSTYSFPVPNMAHVRQARPDFDLGFQVKVSGVPSGLGSGSATRAGSVKPSISVKRLMVSCAKLRGIYFRQDNSGVGGTAYTRLFLLFATSHV